MTYKPKSGLNPIIGFAYELWRLRHRRAYRDYKDKKCEACGAPLEMSVDAIRKQNPEESARPLKRCLYCSTPVGWRYRPFEIKELVRFYALRLLLFIGLFIGLVIIVLGIIWGAHQAHLAACAAKPTAERLADPSCVQITELARQIVTVQASVEPYWKIVEAERLTVAYFNRQTYHVNAYNGGLKPVGMSSSGRWLLLDHTQGRLGIYPLAESPRETDRLDLSRCQLRNALLLTLLWSPNEANVILVANVSGERRIKLATLNTENPSSIQVATCMDIYSTNVIAVDWLDDTYLLYIIAQGNQRELQIRSAFASGAIFTVPLQSVGGRLGDLSVAPQGKYAVFTADDLSGSKQLYWLDLTDQPRLYTFMAGVHQPHAESFFSWVNTHQVVYFNTRNQLVLLDVKANTLQAGGVPPELTQRGQPLWLAWRGGR